MKTTVIYHDVTWRKIKWISRYGKHMFKILESFLFGFRTPWELHLLVYRFNHESESQLWVLQTELGTTKWISRQPTAMFLIHTWVVWTQNKLQTMFTKHLCHFKLTLQLYPSNKWLTGSLILKECTGSSRTQTSQRIKIPLNILLLGIL